MSMKRDLEFLYEMGSLRFVQRTWHRFLNEDLANLAEHHVRVAWIALVLARYEKVEDTGKVLKMALVHDIAESRTGDVDYLSRQYVERNEELGITDMLEDTVLADEFVQLWKEYEERTCIEAKIVKDADNLDIDLELQEQAARGGTLRDVLSDNRERVAEAKLYTDSARRFWKAIKTSNPHDWHHNGRTRLNAGDWKPEKS